MQLFAISVRVILTCDVGQVEEELLEDCLPVADCRSHVYTCTVVKPGCAIPEQRSKFGPTHACPHLSLAAAAAATTLRVAA